MPLRGECQLCVPIVAYPALNHFFEKKHRVDTCSPYDATPYAWDPFGTPSRRWSQPRGFLNNWVQARRWMGGLESGGHRYYVQVLGIYWKNKLEEQIDLHVRLQSKHTPFLNLSPTMYHQT